LLKSNKTNIIKDIIKLITEVVRAIFLSLLKNVVLYVILLEIKNIPKRGVHNNKDNKIIFYLKFPNSIFTSITKSYDYNKYIFTGKIFKLYKPAGTKIIIAKIIGNNSVQQNDIN
jgi:hypothetical protein